MSKDNYVPLIPYTVLVESFFSSLPSASAPSFLKAVLRERESQPKREEDNSCGPSLRG